MKELLPDIERWQNAGQKVAVATVVQAYGSAPRRAGAKMAIAENGEFVGSVSGGCVENDVVEHAKQVIEEDHARLVPYGISDEMAFNVGLACGGQIEVFIQPFGRAFPTEKPVAFAYVVDGEGQGNGLLAWDSGKHRGSIGSAFFDRIRASKGAEQMETPGLEKRETERLFVDHSNAMGPTQAPATITASGVAAASPACILPPEPATDPDDAADSHEAYADAPSTPAASVHSEIIAQSVTGTIVTKETVAVPLGSDAAVEAVPLFQSTTMETSTAVRDAEGNTLHRTKNNPVVLNAEISSVVDMDGEARGIRESRFREEL